MEMGMEFPQNTKLELLYDPAVQFWGIYPKECKSIYNRDTYTAMFFVALFPTAMLWNQSRCLSSGEWIEKRWYIHTMEYYLAITKNEIMSSAGK
jgi:hypothetical protein